MIKCNNDPVKNLLAAQKRKDGQIADGVHIAASISESNEIVSLWIGSSIAGPMLQYSNAGDMFNGLERQEWPEGAWTTIYSNGNFGRRPAHGGTWTSHHKALHPRIAAGTKPQNKSHDLVNLGDDIMPLPANSGIEADVQATNIDCSHGWAIFFGNALDAMNDRLTPCEMQSAQLYTSAKKHLLENDTEDVRERIIEVVKTFGL